MVIDPASDPEKTNETTMKSSTQYDCRYAFVTCAECGRKWQRLDWGSAHHNITCDTRTARQVEPHPDRALTPDEWEAFDDANGVENMIAKVTPPLRYATISDRIPNTEFPFRVFYYAPGMGFETGQAVFVGRHDCRTLTQAKDAARRYNAQNHVTL